MNSYRKIAIGIFSGIEKHVSHPDFIRSINGFE